MKDILETLMEVRTGLGLCWLGNLSWLIRADGRLIATDLDLDRESRIAPSPVATEEIARHLDVHFITHGHGDHFSGPTSRILAERSDCLFVIPANCVDRAREFGIPEARTRVAVPDDRPEGVPTRDPLDVLGIRVEPQRAFHGHTDFTVYRRANTDDCGYVWTLAGKRVYQPGDTVLLQQHVEDFADVDVLFVSPTLHNTHIEATVRLIEAVRPDHVFPQHYGTYVPTAQNAYWTIGYPDEVRAALPPDLAGRFHKIEQGVVWTID